MADADGAAQWSEELLALLSRNAPRQQHPATCSQPNADARRRALAATALEARVRARLAAQPKAERRAQVQAPVFVAPPRVPTPPPTLPAGNLRLVVDREWGLEARARARARASARLERGQQLVTGENLDTLQPEQDEQHAGSAEERGEADAHALSSVSEATSVGGELVEQPATGDEEQCSESFDAESKQYAAETSSASSDEPDDLMLPPEADSDAELAPFVAEADGEELPDARASVCVRQTSHPLLEYDARRTLLSRLRMQLR